MARLTPERVRATYCVEVSKAQALRLHKRSVDGNDTLCAALLGLDGITEVERDGMFGPAVWYTVEAEYDTPGTHAAACALIASHARR